MARAYAQIKGEIWRNADFKALSMGAQWMFVTILSQPNLMRCGVIPYKPRLWAGLAADATPAAVERWCAELHGAGFVHLDAETEELWVVSFIKHDGILKQPNSSKAMASDWGAVLSEALRERIVRSLPTKLQPNFPAAIRKMAPNELKAVLDEALADGFPDPMPDPIADGFGDAIGDGLPEGIPEGLGEGRSVLPLPREPSPGAGAPAHPASVRPEQPAAPAQATYVPPGGDVVVVDDVKQLPALVELGPTGELRPALTDIGSDLASQREAIHNFPARRKLTSEIRDCVIRRRAANGQPVPASRRGPLWTLINEYLAAGQDPDELYAALVDTAALTANSVDVELAKRRERSQPRRRGPSVGEDTVATARRWANGESPWTEGTH
jgi:hypothetical protein